ncbi:TOBE-like domain-containing protein [Tuberibacillus sp. Marseille-P3662]|uniref:TOBE-like domain-containing protein n=1 Tax=Tuberibacillus sp. Marseille-P3662 TaxID=1965358 RepID=UPI000A1C81C3|nr:ATP-binding cassette domain-containing protein [Tuberibacillus sp. Marseille-P3662]
MLTCEVKKTLRDFQLELNFKMDDKTMVIVGPSGCGKSTTLKLLAGLTTPDVGYIEIDEKIFYETKTNIDVSPEHREIGFVFQNYALFPHLSVHENVGYGLDAKKLSKREKRRKVHDILETLHITHLSHSMPTELSGGEQQRVALARALVLNPRALLLDEPLSALDVTTRGRVRRELKKTLMSLNIPTIIVTHDYEDAISLGDRILVMDHGRIIQEGTARDLLMQPRSPFVADFSGTNFFSGKATGSDHGLTRLQINEGNVTLRTTGSADGVLSVMIYSWDIELTKQQPVNDKMNILEGEVVNILSYGNRTRVEIEGLLPLTAEISAETFEELNLKEQETVYAVIDPAAIQVLTNAQEAVSTRMNQIIDVRDPKEFDEEHIPGAKSMPLSEIEERHSELQSDINIMVVCNRGGQRSQKAMELLEEKGYQHVWILEGGMACWKADHSKHRQNQCEQ